MYSVISMARSSNFGAMMAGCRRNRKKKKKKIGSEGGRVVEGFEEWQVVESRKVPADLSLKNSKTPAHKQRTNTLNRAFPIVLQLFGKSASAFHPQNTLARRCCQRLEA